jgi:hypothetical protein
VAVALALAGCGGQGDATAPRQPLTIDAAALRAADIPDGPVSGSLRGRRFVARDIRLHVVEVPGHERVDLIVSDQPIETCGVPGQPPTDRSRRVWLRAEGRTRLDAGELRIEPTRRGEVTAHYEVFEGGRWRGFGTAAVLLAVEEASANALRGRLQACFDDGAASCVRGQVVATPCHSAIDLNMLGERFTKAESEGQ